MKNILFITYISILLIIPSCDWLYPDEKAPTFNAVFPDSSYSGYYVSIRGKDFDNYKGKSVVYFNGLVASNYSFWSDTLIKVMVPEGSTSGNVIVTVNGKNSPKIHFKVLDFETVTIGKQVWMKYNLNVNHYRNGDMILNGFILHEWLEAGEKGNGAYCYYNNDSLKFGFMGKLYNWHAVNDPRGLAPEGWHIATDDEWKEMEIYLGMFQEDANDFGYRGTNQGGKLKSPGTIEYRTGFWYYPNEDANNASGFSAIPQGRRWGKGFFDLLGYGAYFWTSSFWLSTSMPYFRELIYNYKTIYRSHNDSDLGFSVRCIKD